MVYNNIYEKFQPFQIVMPDIEKFEDDRKFLVICVVLELGSLEHAEIELSFLLS